VHRIDAAVGLALLERDVGDTLDMPAVRSALEAINVDPRATTAVEFRELIARDTARWKAVAAKANIKLD